MRRPGLRRDHLRNVAARLHGDLDRLAAAGDEQPHGVPESLYRRTARGKARWLRRVMYQSLATSTEKAFAYLVFDHLNCVTLDAWPSQVRAAQLLGFQSVKTIQRAAGGLEKLELLVVNRGGGNHFRYAPVFVTGDEDKVVRTAGQTRPSTMDTDVQESLLLIHHTLSTTRKRFSDKSDSLHDSGGLYRRSERGAIEFQIAAMLGDDGMEVLGRLGSIDDSIIERLCRAHTAAALGEQELIAAKLAAEQVREP